MPLVSIVLPIYNRAKFLPAAFRSICGQALTDWELIIVDDGSTDTTRECLAELTPAIPNRVIVKHQANQGPYGARNAGLDAATGKYVAFFDSDDVWLPNFLMDCVGILEGYPDVDWVFTACRIVDLASQKTIDPSTFRDDGKPKPFMQLRSTAIGPARRIDDTRACRRILENGFPTGLQNSVIRRVVFDNNRFRSQDRNEAEDRLIYIRSLKRGCRFAYLDSASVIYNLHGEHSSAAGPGGLDKRVLIQRALIRGYERLASEVDLSGAEQRALRRRLSQEYFWQLGYALYWLHRKDREAVEAFEQGIRFWPWNPLYWKTYFLCRIRSSFMGRMAESST